MEAKGALRISLATLLVWAGTGLGCRNPELPVLSPTKTVVAAGSRPPEMTSIISPEIAWKTLKPLERIQRLEYNQYPEVGDFDPLAELTTATAEFFCQSTNCTSSPQELIKGVEFVEFEGFKVVIEQNLGRDLNPEEEKVAQGMLDYIISSEGKRKIFWNLKSLSTAVTDVSSQTVTQLNARDPRTVIYKTALFQSFFLLERSREETDYSMDDPINGKLKISIRGFDLYVQGNDLFFEPPLFASEALAAFFTKSAIDKEIRPLIFLGKSHLEAADLIEDVNRQSGLTNEELLRFFRGQRQRPMRKLLEIWGQENEVRGLIAMYIIGRRANGLISQDDAREQLKSLFSLKGQIA